MTKTNLSVAIATYNEEHNIKDFLNHLSWVPQIIIVDGQSTDKTVSIAKKYKNVNIISTTNKPIFHINKQMAIDACTNDWILQLDADERVSPQLKNEILNIISSKDSLDGYWLKRKNYFLGSFLTKGGQYPDPVIRLFKKDKGKLPCISVHEQIEIDGRVGELKNDLYHYADISFSRYLQRNNRYTSLMANDFVHKKIPISILSFVKYFFIMPIYWFFLTFFRHKAFVDKFPGFVFSWYSSLRFPISYIKYWELKKTKKTLDLKNDWN